MLEKYMNHTSKKIVAMTLALTLAFSSCAAISSLRASAKENSITTSDSGSDSSKADRKKALDNYLEAIEKKRVQRKVLYQHRERALRIKSSRTY